MEKNPSSSSSTRVDRKTIERNRRNHMKTLLSELNALVPRQISRDAPSLPDQLDEAAKYVKKLQVKLEKMNEKKCNLLNRSESSLSSNSSSIGSTATVFTPIFTVHQTKSAFEINVITSASSRYQFLFNEIIRVLHEEGAEVLHANFSVAGDVVVHAIHSNSGAATESKIYERLQKIVSDVNTLSEV